MAGDFPQAEGHLFVPLMKNQTEHPSFPAFRTSVSAVLEKRITELECLKAELENEVKRESGEELDKLSNLLIATVELLEQFKKTNVKISSISPDHA